MSEHYLNSYYDEDEEAYQEWLERDTVIENPYSDIPFWYQRNFLLWVFEPVYGNTYWLSQCMPPID